MIPDAVVILIPIFVGAIGVPLVNFLKAQFNWQDEKALWLSFGVSVILAAGALLLTGSFSVPAGTLPLDIAAKVVEWIGVVFATATMIYKGISEARK